jgi:hypothetical protein
VPGVVATPIITGVPGADDNAEVVAGDNGSQSAPRAIIIGAGDPGAGAATVAAAETGLHACGDSSEATASAPGTQGDSSPAPLVQQDPGSVLRPKSELRRGVSAGPRKTDGLHGAGSHPLFSIFFFTFFVLVRSLFH